MKSKLRMKRRWYYGHHIYPGLFWIQKSTQCIWNYSKTTHMKLHFTCILFDLFILYINYILLCACTVSIPWWRFTRVTEFVQFQSFNFAFFGCDVNIDRQVCLWLNTCMLLSFLQTLNTVYVVIFASRFFSQNRFVCDFAFYCEV